MKIKSILFAGALVTGMVVQSQAAISLLPQEFSGFTIEGSEAKIANGGDDLWFQLIKSVEANAIDAAGTGVDNRFVPVGAEIGAGHEVVQAYAPTTFNDFGIFQGGNYSEAYTPNTYFYGIMYSSTSPTADPLYLATSTPVEAADITTGAPQPVRWGAGPTAPKTEMQLIPEPGSLALILIGALTLAARRRR